MGSELWTLSGWLIGIGAVLIVAGLCCRYYRKSKEVYKGRADGTVIELTAGEPDEIGLRAGVHDYFYPVIAYYAKGKLYKVRYDEGGGNPCAFHIGDKLRLYYDSDHPSAIKIETPNPLKKVSKLLYYLGLLFCVAGGAAFLAFVGRNL